MNLFWVANYLPVVFGLSLFLPNAVLAQELSPKGVMCEAPNFTKENIINIIKRERSINQNLPPIIENGGRFSSSAAMPLYI